MTHASPSSTPTSVAQPASVRVLASIISTPSITCSSNTSQGNLLSMKRGIQSTVPFKKNNLQNHIYRTRYYPMTRELRVMCVDLISKRVCISTTRHRSKADYRIQYCSLCEFNFFYRNYLYFQVLVSRYKLHVSRKIEPKSRDYLPSCTMKP